MRRSVLIVFGMLFLFSFVSADNESLSSVDGDYGFYLEVYDEDLQRVFSDVYYFSVNRSLGLFEFRNNESEVVKNLS